MSEHQFARDKAAQHRRTAASPLACSRLDLPEMRDNREGVSPVPPLPLNPAVGREIKYNWAVIIQETRR